MARPQPDAGAGATSHPASPAGDKTVSLAVTANISLPKATLIFMYSNEKCWEGRLALLRNH